MLEKQVQILSSVLGTYIPKGTEYLFFCPFCKHHKPKLSVNFQKNAYKCWVCDTRGRSLWRLIRTFGDSSQKNDWVTHVAGKIDLADHDLSHIFQKKQEEPPQRIDLPAEFVSLCNKNIPLQSRNALVYLRSRGISKEDIIRWKMGYCSQGDYKSRIVIPSFDSEGYVNYFIARNFTKYGMRYLNPDVGRDIIFNELNIDWYDDIVLVEGVFDAIRIGQNAIPVLGSTLREDSHLFQKLVMNDCKVYTAFDSDAKNKELRVIKALLRYNIEVSRIDTAGYEDVATMPRAVFRGRKQKATAFSDENSLLVDLINTI